MLVRAALLIVVYAAVSVAGKERLTADGLPFTINQKDYKPSTFEMFGQTFYDTNGFPDKSFLPLDNRGYAEMIERCDFEADSVPFYEYSDLSTVIYTPNTELYDKFYGYDLIPENKHNYPAGSEFTLNVDFKHAKDYAKETIMMKRCRLPMEDGGAWHVQRIGPFVSTGGYDWWQVAWPDLGMFSEALAKHPEGIDVIREAFTPVLKDGTRLNYPPIHTHHIHALPQPGTRPRLNSRPMCLQAFGLGIPALDEMARERRCYNLSMSFEQHGDHICRPEDDGLDCLTQGDKNWRRMVAPVDVEGELNDVRPAGSEPMEWYYQVAMRWKPANPKEPVISQVSMFGPGYIFVPSQMTKSLTAPTPTKAESFITYSSNMLVAGDLRRVKIHAHSVIYQASILLSGEYSDFGLADNKFVPHRSYEPIITTHVGFRDNADLGQHILFHLAKSQEYYDQTCLDGEGQVKASALRNPVCRRPRPEWICGGIGDSASTTYEGVEYEFDRRPKTFCKPWTFAVGDPYVVVGFNKPVTKPPLPSNPGRIPPFIGQHTGFFLSYVDHTRGHSAVDTVISVQHGIFHHFNHALTPPGMLARMVAVVLFAGPLVDQTSVTALEWFFAALFTALALYAGSWLVWGARKIPQVDHGVCVVWEVLLAFFTTHKPDWEALAARAKVTGAGKGQSAVYEMVPLTEDADEGMDMDLADTGVEGPKDA